MQGLRVATEIVHFLESDPFGAAARYPWEADPPSGEPGAAGGPAGVEGFVLREKISSMEFIERLPAPAQEEGGSP